MHYRDATELCYAFLQCRNRHFSFEGQGMVLSVELGDNDLCCRRGRELNFAVSSEFVTLSDLSIVGVQEISVPLGKRAITLGALGRS